MCCLLTLESVVSPWIGEGEQEEREAELRAMTRIGARSLDEDPPMRVRVIFPAGAEGIHAIGNTSPTFQLD
jgi:hypothetical protein